MPEITKANIQVASDLALQVLSRHAALALLGKAIDNQGNGVSMSLYAHSSIFVDDFNEDGCLDDWIRACSHLTNTMPTHDEVCKHIVSYSHRHGNPIVANVVHRSQQVALRKARVKTGDKKEDDERAQFVDTISKQMLDNSALVDPKTHGWYDEFSYGAGIKFASVIPGTTSGPDGNLEWIIPKGTSVFNAYYDKDTPVKQIFCHSKDISD